MGRACTWLVVPARQQVSVCRSMRGSHLVYAIASILPPLPLLALATHLVPCSHAVVGLVESLPGWDVVLAVHARELRHAAVARLLDIVSWVGRSSAIVDSWFWSQYVPGPSDECCAHDVRICG